MPAFIRFISSAVRPQTPAGGGSMVPPIRSLPSLRMVVKALRSSARASARRARASLNGAMS